MVIYPNIPQYTPIYTKTPYSRLLYLNNLKFKSAIKTALLVVVVARIGAIWFRTRLRRFLRLIVAFIAVIVCFSINVCLFLDVVDALQGFMHLYRL